MYLFGTIWVGNRFRFSVPGGLGKMLISWVCEGGFCEVMDVDVMFMMMVKSREVVRMESLDRERMGIVRPEMRKRASNG